MWSLKKQVFLGRIGVLLIRPYQKSTPSYTKGEVPLRIKAEYRDLSLRRSSSIKQKQAQGN